MWYFLLALCTKATVCRPPQRIGPFLTPEACIEVATQKLHPPAKVLVECYQTTQ